MLIPRKRSESRTVSEELGLDHSLRNSRQNSDDTGNVEQRDDNIREPVDDVDRTDNAADKDDNHGSEQDDGSNGDYENNKFIQKMTPILYEVIQNLLVDVISVLNKVWLYFFFTVRK